MTAVAASEMKHFVDQGFLVVPGLVSPDDVERARAEASRFADGSYPVTNLPADGNILAVHFPHWVSSIALGLVHHEGIVSVVSSVAGAHLAHWAGGAKCMQSMLFLKPPGLPGQAWHQDERFIPTRDRTLIGAWIALDDATIENGCLWVIPRSHRAGVLHQTRDHHNPDEFDPTDEAFGFDDSPAIPVEVKTGDVVFFNGYLLHRSMKNRSTHTRRALVNHYMSTASLLPWGFNGAPNAAMHDMRTVVVVSGEDPHAWRGYVDPPSSTFVRPATGRFGDSGANTQES